ncbi:hypothetical protein GQ55_9G189700 [Panicum hallii var. hallii]|jgi:hypothetical protein|uniref:Uncharacterized protein n=1 Tax=Panicum hallii var. hallii TaxID=1504633 RepID=A0A2T7C4U8_9POAL|nr:hypothetical protein GQ55_9G189700 [Panicum hallii var. hallii]
MRAVVDLPKSRLIGPSDQGSVPPSLSDSLLTLEKHGCDHAVEQQLWNHPCWHIRQRGGAMGVFASLFWYLILQLCHPSGHPNLKTAMACMF